MLGVAVVLACLTAFAHGIGVRSFSFHLATDATGASFITGAAGQPLCELACLRLLHTAGSKVFKYLRSSAEAPALRFRLLHDTSVFANTRIVPLSKRTDAPTDAFATYRLLTCGLESAGHEGAGQFSLEL